MGFVCTIFEMPFSPLTQPHFGNMGKFSGYFESSIYPKRHFLNISFFSTLRKSYGILLFCMCRLLTLLAWTLMVVELWGRLVARGVGVEVVATAEVRWLLLLSLVEQSRCRQSISRRVVRSSFPRRFVASVLAYPLCAHQIRVSHDTGHLAQLAARVSIPQRRDTVTRPLTGCVHAFTSPSDPNPLFSASAAARRHILSPVLRRPQCWAVTSLSVVEIVVSQTAQGLEDPKSLRINVTDSRHGGT